MIDNHNQLQFIWKKLKNKRVLKRWKYEAGKEIEKYAQNIYTVSPFKTKPVYKKDDELGSFWINIKGNGINIFGIAPNVLYIKGYKAPVNKWRNSEPYNAYFGGKFVLMHKKKVLAETPNIEPLKPAIYGGKSVKTLGYFGKVKTKLGYMIGETDNDTFPLKVYYGQSFADWLMNNTKQEIDRIVLETGLELLETTKRRRQK